MKKQDRPTARGAKTPIVSLDGHSLTTRIVASFARESGHVTIRSAALAAMRRTHDLVVKNAPTVPIYGVNTGFGPMVRHIINGTKLRELQYNLLRAHATGMGTPFPTDDVRAAMLIRLNTLARGFSGVSPALAQKFTELLNHGIAPIVPEHGAVGTSGDLVQLAHIALATIGEGEAIHKGKRRPMADIFNELQITPHKLLPKEGLSLINGTSMMTGVAALVAEDARRLIDIVLRAGAAELEIVGAFSDALDPDLHAVRPHPAQVQVATTMRALLRGSHLISKREHRSAGIHIDNETKEAPEQLQEVYSLRCIPQIMGPIVAALQRTVDTLDIEMNSVTDNPIVEPKRGIFLHGGNFHGDFVATAVDTLKLGLVKMTMLSERRINYFLNRQVNRSFPPFLNLVEPGLTMALQGLQFVATSTTAQNQSFAYPHSVHSIPTNGDNQDVVSMGCDAAVIARRVLDNAYTVATIELVTLSQAVETVPGMFENLSPAARMLVKKVRAHLPPMREDRSLTAELETLREALHNDHELEIAA
jgi:histidine ammonia-lyase